MKKILDVDPIKFIESFSCSEESVATVRGFLYGKSESIEYYRESTCSDFSTIGKCMPKGYKYKTCEVKDLVETINEGLPAVVSIVPDENVKIMEESGLDYARHSIIIHGYDDNGFYVIDSGKKVYYNKDKLNRVWNRTRKDCIVI